ncbi:hypothetical protein [Ancrocorticia populi]|uniref:Uncharacterized protein n=1 Tax=Ancrocorticia populi TaxID=2175228 RepID=A0A2V1KAY9_9ACTO|nr:hypothetical protein [Ancrocorticia populi]PWF26901.1 hypothetical protein DD236_00335 [Ancrocorticia populi]
MFCRKKKAQKKIAAQTPDQVRAVAETLKDSANATSKQIAQQAQTLAAQGAEWAAPHIEDATKKASEYADQATELTKQGIDWATPHVEDAVKKASEYADHATELTKQGIDWATPHVEDALDKANDAKDKVLNDYVPRAKAAAKAANEAARSDGDVKTKAVAVQESTTKALTTSPKKKGRAKKFFGIFAALGALGGGVFYLWKRSQPVEDPWAEAYWEDVKSATPASANTPEPDIAPTPEVATEEVAEEVAEEAAEGALNDEAAAEPEKTASKPEPTVTDPTDKPAE